MILKDENVYLKNVLKVYEEVNMLLLIIFVIKLYTVSNTIFYYKLLGY